MDKEKLIKEVEKILESLGIELVELNTRVKNNPLLEVIIYKEDGVSLDDCTLVSREIDAKLNLDDYFPDKYNIEVASPGLDRKLKTLDDYRRNKNKTLEIRLYSKVSGEKEIIGKLIDYDENKIVVEKDSEKIEIERSNIALMRQYLDFGR